MTSAQRAAFFAECGKAARNLGLDRDEAERYRHRVMDEEAGISSTKDMKRQGQFTACLRRFRLDAGDYAGACALDVSGATEMAYVARVMVAQILQLKGPFETPKCHPSLRSALGEEGLYLDGILRQAGFRRAVTNDRTGKNEWALDMTVRQVKIVIAILDRYRRKILRERFGEGARLTFSDRERYEVNGPITVRVPVNRCFYSHNDNISVFVTP